MRNNILFINGVPKIDQGAGFFSMQLDKEIKNLSNINCLYVSNRIVVGKHLNNKRYFNAIFALLKHLIYRINLILLVYLGMIRKPLFVVLLHQQYIGLKICERIIRKRGNNTILYLLDSGYFCIKSYNYLDDGNGACLKCLGGNFDSINIHKCEPFPKNDSYSKDFIVNLMDHAKKSHISFLTQNEKQTDLVKSHFGKGIQVKTIGIWTADLPEIDDIWKERKKMKNLDFILYHGSPISAKGVFYTFDLAEKCPDIKFIFPFNMLEISYHNIPSNCEFIPMTWYTGLREYAMNARIVLVPSLWSAPIESALVKSVMLLRAVCVVDEETTFSSEIDNKIIIKLSKNINESSVQLKKAYIEQWKPNDEELDEWIKKHWYKNSFPVKRILNYLYN